MQKCARCGNEFVGPQCPKCGAQTEPAANQASVELGRRYYLFIAGLAGVAASAYLFPLVDRGLLPMVALALFFLPLALNAISDWRKSLVMDINRLKIVFLCCRAGVLLIALVLLMNGALDWTPPTIVKTHVLATKVTSGRYVSTRHLIVASWREGRATEDIIVGSAAYSGATAGRQVSLQVHQGLFRLQWYGKVELE